MTAIVRAPSRNGKRGVPILGSPQRGFRLRRLDLVEHRLRRDVLGDLVQFLVGFRPHPHPLGDPRHQRGQLGDLVLRQQADLSVVR
jgi:hypothetical protein